MADDATPTAGAGGATSISITALDGIVNVNSLFTLASFAGLAWNPSDGSTTLASSDCAAGDRAESDLVTFHVLAFGCFLFSSLVALCLKQAIRTVRHHNHAHGRVSSSTRINRFGLRAGILVCSAGTVVACIFLMLALINVVQVRLGTISCGGAALGAVLPLVIFVPAGLFIYTAIVLYAFART